MKDESKYTLYIIFIVTLFIILYELSSVIRYHHALSNGKIGLPTDSETFKIASKKPLQFIKSQLSATHAKFKNVLLDFLKHLLFIGIALLFLNKKFQEKMSGICEKRITFIQQGFRTLKRSEINYMCLIFLLYLFSILLISSVKSKELDYFKVLQYLLLFLGIYFFIAPLFIFVLFMVLNKFHKKFIVACYVAYALKVLPELLMDDPIDHEKMTKMKIEEFPDDIQAVLKKYDLQDSVYKEIDPGSELNAALIGYGSAKRMEIYGDVKSFSNKELYAIFLHEVGHVDEHSLFRKSVVYFLILFLEMMIILFIYDKLAPKYANEFVSMFTAFVILVFIYRTLVRQWPLSVNKITSQMSEINSDLFTEKYDYNRSLAKTLYGIGVGAKDYLVPTRMYNGLRSTHPSIYSRVEYLQRI